MDRRLSDNGNIQLQMRLKEKNGCDSVNGTSIEFDIVNSGEPQKDGGKGDIFVQKFKQDLAQAVGLRTVPYTVYGRNIAVSVSYGNIRIPYHQLKNQASSASVQILYGRRRPFTNVHADQKMYIHLTSA